MPDFAFESSVAGPVAGIDEAGRGPWAGPVVAAAIVLDPARIPDGLDDSKKLAPARREAVFPAIIDMARVGVGIGSVEEIETLNIRGATHLAMRRAVEALGFLPRLALVDGNDKPKLPCAAATLVRGDGLSLSIAAASIVAKVTRDRMMAVLDAAHPGYGWIRNKGYGTPEHREALERLGVTAHHRRLFAPIHKMLGYVESEDSRLNI